MNRYPFIILVVSLCFFTLFQGHYHRQHRSNSHLGSQLPGLPKTDSHSAIFWRALVVGDEQGFKKEDKERFYQLGLGHLFTPSGTHLATLNPLLKHLRFLPLIYLVIGCLLTFRPELSALNRVVWLKSFPKSQKIFLIYLIMMLIEGAFISWKDRGLSWTCSFLFLGFCWFSPKAWTSLWFICGQILICWVFQQPYSLMAPLTGAVMNILLMLIFPAILTLSFIPPFHAHSIALTALGVTYDGILFIDKVHTYLPAIAPHFGHLVLTVAWIIVKERKWLALILLSLSSPTGQITKISESTSRFEVLPDSEAKIINYRFKTAKYSDGVNCRVELRDNIWKESCRLRTRRQQMDLRNFH